MHYNELKDLQMAWKGKVCLFGAGLIGGTWAYDVLKEIGFQIDFYCDNNKEENIEIRDGVKTISLDKLYSFKDRILVFITVSEKNSDSIRRQLERNGIQNIIQTGYLFMQTFAESLLEINSKGLIKQFSCVLDDVQYTCGQYKCFMGYPLNLDNPQTFNEKIQWLKLYDKNPEYVHMVDKYEAKKYVANIIGEEYIVPTLGIYDTFDEIEFDKLPQQFVLKCTHDSGSIVICREKDKFDRKAAKGTLEYALQRNFYWVQREWVYYDLKPRIIAEPYLGKQLRDYKTYNFNGKAKMLHVDLDRYGNHTRNFYSSEWEYLDIMLLYPTNPQAKVEKPKQFEKMMELAETLSKDKAFVRADFYNEDGKIYFGEMTFYPGGGLRKIMPEEMEYEVGSWIKLPSKVY